MSETKIVGQYYRSRDGKTFHLAPCPHMGRAVPWKYAVDMSLREVVAVVRQAGYRLCRHCWPADAQGGAR